MDAIEQRLTTDLTAAQAVVDLGEIVNHVPLDRGRPVNLVRIGMVLDALSRYLVDGGAMLYGVADRDLLAEPALTSKERMVLGRWADDGRIEVTPTVGDALSGAAEKSAGSRAGQNRGAGAQATDLAQRVVEIADLTGLPLIALHPYAELADRYGWLRNSPGRVLRLTYRSGFASLRPLDGAAESAVARSAADAVPGTPAVGRARVPVREQAGKMAVGVADPAANPTASTSAAEQGPARSVADSVPGAGEPRTADGEVGEVAPAAADTNGAPVEAKSELVGTGGKNGAPTTTGAGTSGGAEAVEPGGQSARAVETGGEQGVGTPADRGAADSERGTGTGAESGVEMDSERGARATPESGAGSEPDAASQPGAVAGSEASESGVGTVDEPGDGATDERRDPGKSGEDGNIDKSDREDGAGEPAAAEPLRELPLPLTFFADRGARVARTRVSRHRFRRGEPSSRHSAVLRREWRCDSFDCPAFGEHRQIGQPVPRIRGEVPVCPRHDQPVTDLGPRPPAYAVSIVVDDLPRQRVVVRGGHPVEVGRATDESAGNEFAAGPSEPDRVSVAQWLHQSAAAWISPIHLRLEACDDGLVITDLSDNGTVVWQRKGPDGPGTTRLLRRETYTLGEWDGVELYTGIELVRADRRLTAVLGRDEPTSVLLDAPTAAHQQVANG